MICDKCGQELSDDSSFCNKCGNPLSINEEAVHKGLVEQFGARHDEVVVSDKSKRKYRMLGIAILGIALLAICSLAIYNLSVNRISTEVYKTGVKHLDEVEGQLKQGDLDGINKSIDSFKEMSKNDKLSENDKEFYSLVSNLDMLQLTKTVGAMASVLGNKTLGQDVFVRCSALYDTGKKILLSKDIKKIKTYNATFGDNFKAMMQSSSPKMEVVDGWTWRNEGNYSYVRGSVKNVSDAVITYFKVTAEYLDSSGNVLDTDFTNSGEAIRPGNQKEFEIMHHENSNYAKVRVFVDEVR